MNDFLVDNSVMTYTSRETVMLDLDARASDCRTIHFCTYKLILVFMGRNYFKELQLLDSSYQWAKNYVDVSLEAFNYSSGISGLITIGSGGSYSAALFASLMHQTRGEIAKTLTPFQFIQSTFNCRNFSVQLFSARGQNNDIRKAISNVVNKEPKNISLLCGREKAPAIDLLHNNSNNVFITSFKSPNGKDGFLAVNSLLVFSTLIYNQYVHNYKNYEQLPESLNELLGFSGTFFEYIKLKCLECPNIFSKRNLLVLYDYWSQPAAFDLESKFSEAALGHVQYVDYRNFGHGRHNYVETEKDKIGIICLSTPQSKILVKNTISKIPHDIPLIHLKSKQSDGLGALSLLVQVLHLVGEFSKSQGIDPGRPKIKEYGKKIYKIKIPNSYIQPSFHYGNVSIPYPIIRKIGYNYTNMESDQINFWINAYNDYLNLINSTKFYCIVFDYDGTLCNWDNRYNLLSNDISEKMNELLSHGIKIGIATGRGKSARIVLQKVIKKEHWDDVLLGYYNGAALGLLSESDLPNNNVDYDESIYAIMELLQSEEFLGGIKYEARPFQISISSENVYINSVVDILKSKLSQNLINNVKMVMSDHSLDIIPQYVSKISVLQNIQKMHQRSRTSHILCIGDKGKFSGNDYELLSTPYSLSVDEVSVDPKSCWNLLSLGKRGISGTLEYLDQITLGFEEALLNLSKHIK